MTRILVLFAKVPQPGRVKTRLAAEIGAVPALWWYRHQLARLVRRVGHDRRWRTVLAVSPDLAGMNSRLLPDGIRRWPQGGGDLGQRMAHALRRSPGPVLVVGSDIPGVTAAHVARAFRVLNGRDAVLGPALDGGYWLIGLARGRCAPPGLFQGVRWSGPHAMTDTARTLGPLRIGYADTMRDVDTAADLRAYGR